MPSSLIELLHATAHVALLSDRTTAEMIAGAIQAISKTLDSLPYTGTYPYDVCGE
jgi:hypothetical protein